MPSPQSLTAVVIQHEPTEGLELLGEALERAGFTPVLRMRDTEPGDAQAPLLVSLGGTMSATDPARYPWLAAEHELLRRRLSAGLPCLGICLGAQLLASAAGAQVSRGALGMELGALPVQLTDEGLLDPVFQHLPPSLVVAHWHEDTFASVPGATLLASSAAYPQQAFRLGDSYGLQFHPELDAQRLAAWLARAPEELSRAGLTPRALKRQLAQLEAAERDLATLRSNLAQRLATLAALGGARS